ncbi:hypothetical protein HHI36_012920 [Cryptolaemus montrouzieri]|uniref:Zinc finger PHD-type domain-containing protein n=1 Tax=Cryptolaemus montrouzieri TaxID=559131 RepID=A0ABD2NGN3_9CUCU
MQNIKIGRYDDHLLCMNENCGNSYHIKCLNMSIEEYAKLRESPSFKSWVFEECENEVSQPKCLENSAQSVKLSLENIPTDIVRIIETGIKAALGKILPEIIDQFETEMNELKAQNNILRGEINKLTSVKAS